MRQEQEQVHRHNNDTSAAATLDDSWFRWQRVVDDRDDEPSPPHEKAIGDPIADAWFR